ncbi:hypothetical protein EYC80_002599 [Monilinia laxa]|uniref:Uncharacterized protein n=1 Tax=Monilinia laxa TaxID=61186 RepID=A0A5N6K4C5_MONLA|nr:hypothetical protein EYC80_002599 [Monilinia laxa]
MDMDKIPKIAGSEGEGVRGGEEQSQGQQQQQQQQQRQLLGKEEKDQGLQLPRVTIQFCTQCKWMLRAAYFAQELLSTFGTDIGEVALQPSTGGTFIVELFTEANSKSNPTSNVEGPVENEARVLKHTLWDRKSEGGFPETKELKKRLRNIIDPSRDLGHVDGKKSTKPPTTTTSTSTSTMKEQPHSTDASTKHQYRGNPPGKRSRKNLVMGNVGVFEGGGRAGIDVGRGEDLLARNSKDIGFILFYFIVFILIITYIYRALDSPLNLPIRYHNYKPQRPINSLVIIINIISCLKCAPPPHHITSYQ